MSAENGYAPRLRTRYKDEVVPALRRARTGQRDAGPGLEKVVINMGVGEAVRDGLLGRALEDLAIITGQKAVVTKAGSRSPASSCAKAWRSARR